MVSEAAAATEAAAGTGRGSEEGIAETVGKLADESWLGLREMFSYAIPGGSGMRRKHSVVGVKCLGHLVEEFTHADSVGGPDPEWHKHTHRKLRLTRHAHDGGVAALGLYRLHKDGETRIWVGGNHFKFHDALREPNKKFSEELPLYVGGTPTGGAGSGIVSIRYKWVPAEETCNLEDQDVDPAFRGELVVTILKARGLVIPDRIVRDVTTYVDTTPVILALTLLAVYLLVGFVFYFHFMNKSAGLAADVEKFPKLLQRVQGGNGDWTAMNTLLFMITSFTTVGYGNHPSLVATLPPCEVPGPQLLVDDPHSVLLPPQLRSKSMMGILATVAEESTQSFPPLPANCFDIAVPMEQPDECMYIADDSYIFDFNGLLLWRKESMEPPRNFSGVARASELHSMHVPGDIGVYDCSSNVTQTACYARFAAICEEQLTLWRAFEQQKDVAKVFTTLFIMIGIGILGGLVGAIGETLMEWVRNLLGGVEYTLDRGAEASAAVAAPVTSAASPFANAVGNAVSAVPMMNEMATEIDFVAVNSKGILVAMIGLCIVIAMGAVFYAHAESLKWVDAIYFTVVTATTVGFGDYCPETDTGKLFTLFYVPFSVVVVAGLINHVAAVPLETRKENLEKFVLAQFASSPTLGDFDDIRRSAGITSDASIRANDFLIAMTLRLGFLKADDCHEIKRIFEQLDMSGDGELTTADIDRLVSLSPTRPSPIDTDASLAAISPPETQPAKSFRRLGSWDGQAERELGRNESLLATSSDGVQGDDNIAVSSNPLEESRSTPEQAGDNI